MFKKLKYALKNRKFKKRNKVFGPFTKGIIYDTDNGLIAMSHQDMMIGKHLGFRGKWNLNEIEFLKKIIRPEDTIYFVGTHVGTLLLPIAKACKTVVGYEANPGTYWFLKKNLLLNEIENTRVFNFAVGDQIKKITFYQSRINTGGSKIKPLIDNFRYKFDSPEEVEVDMVALDGHIKEQSLPQPDGIVMDIEGAEYFALKGMTKTLESIRFLYMEYVPHHLKNVSDTTHKELIALIKPHFSKVISQKKNTEFSLENSVDAFYDYLGKLDSSDHSDDLLFLK